MTLTAVATWRMLRAIRAYATSQERLAHQATHDSLTGLPNRTFVRDALADRAPRDGLIALLFLDIDRFKLVNDSQGHSLGDDLLQAVARRLLATTRPGDLVARVGGDLADGLGSAAGLGIALEGQDEPGAAGEQGSGGPWQRHGFLPGSPRRHGTVQEGMPRTSDPFQGSVVYFATGWRRTRRPSTGPRSGSSRGSTTGAFRM